MKPKAPGRIDGKSENIVMQHVEVFVNDGQARINLPVRTVRQAQSLITREGCDAAKETKRLLQPFQQNKHRRPVLF